MMKAITLILALFSLSVIACNAKTPPAAVSNAFSQKFAQAEKVKWSMEDANEWEAEFRFSGKEMSASFDPSGKWLETETEIEPGELPSNVKSVIEKDFAGAKIGETAIVESPDFSGFEIELKYQGKNMEVQVAKDGKIHKQTAAND